MKTETLATAVETFYKRYEQLAREGSSMRNFLSEMQKKIGGPEAAVMQMTNAMACGIHPIFSAVSSGVEYSALYNRATNRIDLYWKDASDFGEKQVIRYDKTLELAL